jgi:putative acyl-CoA dehydrogenase
VVLLDPDVRRLPVLAQADPGLSCFVFPRWTPDGEAQRLPSAASRDKLGNHTNASSGRVRRSLGALVGDGVPVRAIIEMVNHRARLRPRQRRGMRAGVIKQSTTRHITRRSARPDRAAADAVLATFASESGRDHLGRPPGSVYDDSIAGDNQRPSSESPIRFSNIGSASARSPAPG